MLRALKLADNKDTPTSSTSEPQYSFTVNL